MPSTEKTFADEFVEAGYKTAYFGKWHCGELLGYRPDQRGFQIAKATV